MTNTLHRFGSAESFRDDYIVFAIASKGRNDEGALEKLRRFLEMAVQFNPVNLGDSVHGGALRPSKKMTPLEHWKREATPDFEAVIRGLDTPGTVAAVFDNRPAAEDFVAAVKRADLGLSVNISTSIDGAEQCCFAAGIPRHSVGYSLGFEGDTSKAARIERDAAFDHVRSRNDRPQPRGKNDRLGERGPPHAGRGRRLPHSVLFLRSL